MESKMKADLEQSYCTRKQKLEFKNLQSIGATVYTLDL